ncbi:hypothetical protein F5X96DRAFT_655766 [Biscogniauxia mediterranea]|nr:hypothetical protein F5X96DRAFT_655766 [Biscogniauxia mediterranea]
MASGNMDFLDYDDEEGYYDEDAIYKADHENLVSGVHRSNIPLYRQPTAFPEGEVKAHHKGGEYGQLVYGKDKADYGITVERLVWVDGWRETIEDNGHKKHHDDMTLVVLKVAFATKTPDSKVEFAHLELRFKSQYKNGKDPEVVAWGPFHRLEAWNSSSAQRRTNLKGEGKLGVDYVSFGVAGEDETAWDRIDFDCGKTDKLFNLTRDVPVQNGVRWKLKQNSLHNQGVTPEFRVAVLLKRPSTSDTYLVDLRLVAITGTVSALKNKVGNFLGLRDGESHYWCVTPQPGDKNNCYAEGLDIIQSVDTDNLGKLVPDPSNSQNLNPSWLNTWDRFEVPKVKSFESESEFTKVSKSIDIDTTAVAGPIISVATAAGGLEGGLPVAPELPPPGLSRIAPVQTSSPIALDYSRLVTLEARAAQAEARIATQDQIIFSLQQTVARMEQIVSSFSSDRK